MPEKTDTEPPSEDLLKGMFEESMKRNPDKLGFTKEEGDKFGKAFADPEFRKMFADYMDELQDPANRAETEAYISQLEGEQKVPEGKELIRPASGFVAKSFKIDKGQKGEKGDKVWMNIVHSEKVMKPSSERTDKGESWSVPYSLGPPHMEKDNKGDNVATFDCCFHSDALQMALQRKAFQNLLVQTALEGVEESYKRQNLPTKLSRDYHILKGVNYKSGVIGTMLVDKRAAESWKNNETPEEQRAAASKKLADKLNSSGTDKKPRSKEEVAAAVAKAREAEAAKSAAKSKEERNKWVDDMIAKETNGESINKRAASVGKSGGGDFKKGFLEGKGGSRPKKKTSLIQEISSTANTNTADSNKKKTSPPKAPAPDDEIEKEASALASKSTAEVKGIEQNAAATSRKKVSSGGTLEIGSGSGSVQSGQGPIEPKYTVTERGLVDWGDFELSRDGQSQSSSTRSTRPKELVVRIELPRVAAGQTGQVELDVAEKHLSLKYKDVYSMRFTLPYRVDDKKGAAKFEKAKQALVVTLPLAKPTEEELRKQMELMRDVPTTKGVRDVTNDEKSAAASKSVDSSAKSKSASKASEVKSSSPSNKKNKETNKATPSPHVEGLTEEEIKASEKLKNEIAAAAKVAKEQAEREANDPVLQARKKEQREKAAKEREAEARAEEAKKKAEANGVIDTSVKFIASESFQGRKPGYVFKRSDAGLGYHVDVPLSKVAAGAGEAQPAPIKSRVSQPKKPAPVAPASIAAVPALQMKQTTQAVSVIVPIANIEENTVKVSFTESGATCTFSSAKDKFAFQITVSKGLQSKQNFDVSKCKFDVAKKNMVLVLMKSVNAAFNWSTSDPEGDLLLVKPWTEVTGSSPKEESKGEEGAKVKEMKDIDSLVKQANSMQFSNASNQALFDLD